MGRSEIDQLAEKYLDPQDYLATRMMNWEQIIEVKNKGHEIGVHTHNHYYINSLTEEDLMFEMKHSKERLEEELHTKINTFAFPGAKYNEGNIKLANDLGLENCLLMDNQTTTIGNKQIYRYLSYGNSALRLLIQSLGIETMLRR